MSFKKIAESFTIIKRFKLISNIDYLLLFILTAVHGINNYIWLRIDRTSPPWDAAEYLTFSYRYHNLFKHPTLNLFIELFNINRQRPPLRLLINPPFFGAWGMSYDAAVIINIFFIFILLFSVYGIGKYLFSRQVGLLSAFTVSFFPIIHGLSRSYLMDFPTTAMVALSIYLLLKTDYFANNRYSIYFGVSMGLGVLIRDTFPIFLLGPVLYIMYRSKIIKILWLFKQILSNFVSAILIFISGLAVGSYLIYMITEIFWKDDPRISGKIKIMIIISSIVLLFAIWILLSISLYSYSNKPLKGIFMMNSISITGSLIMGLVWLPAVSESGAFVLAPISIIITIVSNLILLRGVYSEWLSKRKLEGFRKHPWLNFNRSLFMGILVAGWWYLPSLTGVLPNLILNPTYVKPEEGHINLASWESISYYFISLLNQQIYLFFFILIICIFLTGARYGKSILSAVKKTKIMMWPKTLIKADWNAKLTLFLWFVVPYMFFSLAHTKNSRYISPYLPAIAIFMAAALLSLKKTRHRVIAVLIVLSLGGFQMVTFSYGMPGLPDQVVISTPIGDLLVFGQEPLGRHQYYIHPDSDDWKVDDILLYINDNYEMQLAANGSKITDDIDVGLITDGVLNAYIFTYTVLEKDLPIVIHSTAFYETDAWLNSISHSFYSDFNEFDYLIELENFTLRPQHNESSQFFHEPENFGQFERINSFLLPENQIIVVYRRI